MNENLNLVKILKDCPKGTKLYSPIYGDVELVEVLRNEEEIYPIEIKTSDCSTDRFTKDGRIYADYDGECTLFPSREQRDWDLFTVPGRKKEKFDPNTLKTFDRVLVRDGDGYTWRGTFFSHINNTSNIYKYATSGGFYEYCIPYNDDTKHLVNTADEAPEFYRYWED